MELVYSKMTIGILMVKLVNWNKFLLIMTVNFVFPQKFGCFLRTQVTKFSTFTFSK